MINRSVRDGFRFLSLATPARVMNAARILSSYYLSMLTSRPVHRGMPVSVSIEPTTSCNLRCPECPSGLRSFTRPTGMLDEKLYIKALDELSEKLWYLILYFQGEPYLHSRFYELVQHAVSRNIYTATSTNGHYLSKENAEKTVRSGLHRLIISIDGTTQETYAAYRKGGNLEKVLQGAANVIEARKKLKSSTPHVIFQFLVVKPNEHQVEEVKSLAKKLGVDEVGFKTAQIYNYENGNPLIPDNGHYSRYKPNGDGTWSLKNKISNNCWKLWHSCVISWDGGVLPCCFDKDGEYRMGDLSRSSFQEIWTNQAYANFRASLIRSRSENAMCVNCTEGTSVWAG